MKANLHKIRILLISITTVLLFFSYGLFAQENIDVQFQNANQLYTKGDYKSALEGYLSLQDAGLRSGELFYNIGNTYYKSNELGEAILYYERALKYMPMDEDLLTNLQLANLSIADKITPIPELFYERYWRTFKYLVPFSTWRIKGYILYILTGVWIVLRILLRNNWLRRVFIPVLAALAAGTILSFWIVVSIEHELKNGDTGIIQSEEVQVRASPADDGTELFSLHEGTKIWIKRQSGGWSEIRIADGKTGWLLSKSMEII